MGLQRIGHGRVTFIHSFTATSEDLEAKKGCWGTKAVYCTYPQHTPPPKGKANHPSTPAQPLDSPLSSLHIRNQLAHLRSKQGDLPVISFCSSCYSKSPNKNLDRISWLTSYQFLLIGKGQVSWSVSEVPYDLIIPFLLFTWRKQKHQFEKIYELYCSQH